MRIPYEISLDMKKQISGYVVTASTGDVDTRFIKAKLYSGYDAVSLSDVASVVIIGKKLDGTEFNNPCTIEADFIHVTLTSQMSAVEGMVDCQLMVYGKNGSVTPSPVFSVFVSRALSIDGIISTNEYKTLELLLSEVGKIKEENGTLYYVTEEVV